VKLGKSTTDTFEMLREAFGEYSLSQTAISWPVKCQLKKTNIQGDQAPAK
jgi:hypothetical protein